MIVHHADTADQMRQIMVDYLQDKIAAGESKVKRYKEAVENGGKIPGVISGIRKKDVDAAITELGVYRSLLTVFGHSALIEPTANRPGKVG